MGVPIPPPPPPRALFIYKIINKTSNVPTIFKQEPIKGTLTPASEVHSYNTRFVSNHNFYRPRIRNSYGAATFAFAGSKVWENKVFHSLVPKLYGSPGRLLACSLAFRLPSFLLYADEGLWWLEFSPGACGCSRS